MNDEDRLSVSQNDDSPCRWVLTSTSQVQWSYEPSHSGGWTRTQRRTTTRSLGATPARATPNFGRTVLLAVAKATGVAFWPIVQAALAFVIG